MYRLGGLKHVFSHTLGTFISPIDEIMFFRGIPPIRYPLVNFNIAMEITML